MKKIVFIFALLAMVGITQAADTITSLDGSQGWNSWTAYNGDVSFDSFDNATGATNNGSVMLTTQYDNKDRANIEFSLDDDSVGAAAFLSSAEISYEFYKVDVAGGNTFASPAFKIGINSLVGSGDNYGELIYEANWNTLGFEGSSKAVPTDVWQVNNLDMNSGLWWWTGGFDEPSGAGGPPLRTLSEWVSVLGKDNDFASAYITHFGVGVGSYNQGQIGYVDDISISGSGFSGSYDFAKVPAPGAILLAGLGTACVGRIRRRVI